MQAGVDLLRDEERATNALVDLSATALSEGVLRRRFSCREVVSAFLDHIDIANPVHNAIVSLRPRGSILAEADARDNALARGKRMGWLHGLPIAIKDLSPVAGLPNTRGSPIFAGAVATRDAAFAARLKQAGTIIVGKTNTAEFGLGAHTYNAVFGSTRNALDVTLSAGGSSGGAAVAVAARILPVADGGDNMGSLRIPAAFNAIYAFRPSEGVIPAEGRLACAPLLLTVGPLAKSVADLEALLGTLAAAPWAAPDLPIEWVRSGWLHYLEGYLAVEPEVLAVCERALQRFSSTVCIVESVRARFDFANLWRAYRDLRAWLNAATLGDLAQDPVKCAQLKDDAVDEIERGLSLSGLDIFAALGTRARWRETLRGLFARYDALLLPAAPCLPFAAETTWPRTIAGRTMDSYCRWMEVAILATMGGAPVAALPAGLAAEGRPAGLQLLCGRGRDSACLDLARAYEHANVGSRPRSPSM